METKTYLEIFKDKAADIFYSASKFAKGGILSGEDCYNKTTTILPYDIKFLSEECKNKIDEDKFLDNLCEKMQTTATQFDMDILDFKDNGKDIKNITFFRPYHLAGEVCEYSENDNVSLRYCIGSDIDLNTDISRLDIYYNIEYETE